jgi:hypothetical protein
MDLSSTLGTTTTFAKTVSESDVYQFAGITGDFARPTMSMRNSCGARNTGAVSRMVHC